MSANADKGNASRSDSGFIEKKEGSLLEALLIICLDTILSYFLISTRRF